ncbi:MAG: HAD family phosphatase [Acidobacteria bacterium]|nr:HAD family phosphatase [Acidobacteriota bacterium]
MLKAIVFDFDGVIANSEPLHFQAFRDVLAGEGVTLTEQDYYARYLGYDDRGVFRIVGEERGAGWTAARVSELAARKAARLEALEAMDQDASVLFPGAADAIKRAAAAAPLAIASGAIGAEIRRVLDRERLAEYFTVIVAAEDTPSSKPAPDPYLHAVALLAHIADRGEAVTAAECVAIEDSRWGLESARAAGLKTVGVAQTYPASELDSADLVIANLDELNIEHLVKLCSK